jgi:hypothetical protein
MPGLGLIWSFLTSRLGGWVVLSGVTLVLLGVLKLEHNAKLRAEAREATMKAAYQIGYEGYVKLYQERDKIKAQADSQRRKLNELQQNNDLDGLADIFNSPGGVHHSLPPNSPGGPGRPARYKTADGTPAEYQETP